MGQMITGRESLRQIDRVIARLREQVSDAIQAADEAQARRTQVRQEQVDAYSSLTALRLHQLSDAQAHQPFLDAEKKALRLLSEQEDYVANSQRALDAAASEIYQLEQSREALSQKLDLAVDAYEDQVERIESKLIEQPDYLALKAAFDDAEAISERAHSKLAVAEDDMRDKGAPYENDPLFSYLWRRNFRTPSYKAGPFFRMMDDWVAGLCNYDDARLNYKRLTELPIRLSEHAQQTDAAREAAEDALEAAEARALADGGADALKDAADEIREGVDGLDHLIQKAETAHQELAKDHEAALASESGPASQARHVLEQAIRAASFPDLRVLASQTVDESDDRLVDRLVKLRAEEMEFELSARELEARPEARRRELETLEDFRRAFKRARYDSPYAEFRGSAVDAVISSLLRGGETRHSAMRYLAKNLKRTRTRVDPGFGGGPRNETLGLPGVLGDIAIEIAKEAARSGSYGGYRGPRRTPWRVKPTKRRLPSIGKRRGGFKTGGGF